MKILLKNGKITTHEASFKGCIEIIDQKISEVQKGQFEGDNPDFDFVLDCTNKFIIPGIIDPHVHLRDWGQKYKETVETGSLAAKAGGVTTVLAMPNTQPRITNIEMIEQYRGLLENDAYIDTGLYMNLSNDFELSQIDEAASKGIAGIKIYPGDQSSALQLEWKPLLLIEESLNERFNDDTWDIADLKRAFHNEINRLIGMDAFYKEIVNWQKLFFYMADFEMPILFHPDTPISQLKRRNRYQSLKAQKFSDLIAHSKTYSIFQEALFALYITKIIEVLINNLKMRKLSEKFPTVCFCHVSCPEVVDIVNDFRDNNHNVNLKIEAAPHHLFLNYERKVDTPAFMKVLQPVRSQENMEKMQNLLKNGYLDYFGTDHAPHSIEEKTKDFLSAPSGISSLDVYVKFILTKVMDGIFNLMDFVRYSAYNPAKIFNIDAKGCIKAGYDADLVVFSQTEPHQLNPETFKSKAKWSPYPLEHIKVDLDYVFLRGYLIQTSDLQILQKYPNLAETYNTKLGKYSIWSKENDS